MLTRFLSILIFLGLAWALLRGRGSRRRTDCASLSIQRPFFPCNSRDGISPARSRTSKDPAVADSVNAALLKEYGLTDFESGTYTRDDGRKVALKAIRFTDASGAYGAFTYYKMPQMLKESIPDQASSLNERVLFYRGNILVDAVFDKLTAMSAAELRELVGRRCLCPPGTRGNLPILPQYLPKTRLCEEHREIRDGSGRTGEDQRAAFSRNWWTLIPARKWPWARTRPRAGWPR